MPVLQVTQNQFDTRARLEVKVLSAAGGRRGFQQFGQDSLTEMIQCRWVSIGSAGRDREIGITRF